MHPIARLPEDWEESLRALSERGRKALVMEHFYRMMRKRFKVLLADDGAIDRVHAETRELLRFLGLDGIEEIARGRVRVRLEQLVPARGARLPPWTAGAFDGR